MGQFLKAQPVSNINFIEINQQSSDGLSQRKYLGWVLGLSQYAILKSAKDRIFSTRKLPSVCVQKSYRRDLFAQAKIKSMDVNSI